MSTIRIAGASSGLGAEMARQLAAKGHDLALCARRTDRLDELSDEILRAHPDRRVAVRALDVTDDDAVFRVFGEFAEQLGRIDKVIVNAGLGKGARIGTGGYAANRATAMTNFVGALAQTEAAMEIFREQRYGALPVLDKNEELAGIISPHDLLGALEELLQKAREK